MLMIWEDSEFPILCESCLGSNPYVRMLREGYGKECKFCGRPFTVFKWSPGEGMRWKKTEVCQTCTKIKNVCQCCLLDLDYALPTKIRDAVLESHSGMPTTDVNTQVYVRKMEEQMGDDKVVNHGKAEAAAKEVLRKLERKTSDLNQQKKRAVACAFFLKGICKRGEECPLSHDRPQFNTHRKSNPNDKGRAGKFSGPPGGSRSAATHSTGPVAVTGAGGLSGATPTQNRPAKQHKRRNGPPQSHAQAHAQNLHFESISEMANPSAAALAVTLSHLPPPPPPPGQGPSIMHPSQNPSILGTATRSFRS
ncbi:hypothetical protein BASA50_007883 [Batrachochytrium salamandrivorans]|uniref:C3H1-type domain-containing protein n=1 Tax=Batrachochytrium salamandrivorans TaxID=1357716 RepID=A0ABQ8F5Y4_9FUNG|nr:hypothetical protein BASA50_007883 [Batrachochytrium salamandrivorans]